MTRRKQTFGTRRCLALIALAMGLLAVHGPGLEAQQESKSVGSLGELPVLTEPTEAAQQAQASPFEVRALHLSFNPNNLPISDLKTLIDQASLRGYNMVVLSLGNTKYSILAVPAPDEPEVHVATPEQMRGLIAHIRDAGVEPAVAIKAIGKQPPMLMRLAEDYPGVVVHDENHPDPDSFFSRMGVLNSEFRFPDGRDPYEAVYLPLLDLAISWFGEQKPTYFFLGTDEVPLGALAKVAEKAGLTAAELYARDLNRLTAHLLEQGITPVIWGDNFLSKRLAQPGVVEGWPGDPRFETASMAFHADYHAHGSDASFLPVVNLIDRREDIVVVDWHYRLQPEGAYPSVDFFQAMGFKDVWATTWYNEAETRQFTRYAASRDAGGMIASTWVVWKSRPAKFPPLVNNSILYYLDPSFEPPRPLITSHEVSVQGDQPLAQGDWGVVLPLTAQRITVTAQIPDHIRPAHPRIWLVNEAGGARLSGQSSIAQDGSLRARIDLGSRQSEGPGLFTLWIRYLDEETGYMAQKEYPGVVRLSETAPPTAGDASDDALLQADFSALSDAALDSSVLLAPGEYGGMMFLRDSSQSQADVLVQNALNTAALEVAYVIAQPGLWERIEEEGMRLIVEAKLTQPLEEGDWGALATLGNYSSGLRLLVNPEGQVQMQFARTQNGSVPVRMSPGSMEMGQWERIEVRLSPPNAQGQRRAAVRLNDGEPVVEMLPRPLTAPRAGTPLGVGVQFAGGGTDRTRWPSFPGLIRRVAILPFGE